MEMRSYNPKWVFALLLVISFCIISVSATDNYNAKITAVSGFPSQMNAGQKYQGTVTVQNTGSLYWDGYSALVGFNQPNPDYSWGAIAATGGVAASKSKTFSISVTAPSSPGNYKLTFRMQHLSTWFGTQSTPFPVTVVAKPIVNPTFIIGTVVMGSQIKAGNSFSAEYFITNTNSKPINVGLGMSITNQKTGISYNDKPHDKIITAAPGRNVYSRTFSIPKSIPKGKYTLIEAIWSGTPGSSTKYQLATYGPFEII